MRGVAPDARLFLLAAAAGAVISLFYDLFRILRAALPHGKAATFVEDLLFSAAAFFTVCAYTLTFTDGVFRWFTGAGIALGFAVCRFTLGEIIMRTVRFILIPLRAIVRYISKFSKKTLLFLKKPFIFVQKRVRILFNRLLHISFRSRRNRPRGKSEKIQFNIKTRARRGGDISALRLYKSAGKNKRKEKRTQRL